ncbi:MAG: NAD-dependent epimerase/dehydratase family protein, partial [Deinococcus-Thermus bacterium]|nr:NAD-dependent epimerase/dehydratase family protein [Deinococcota bacterium]
MTARVVVSGGAGYIGAHACKALAAAGYLPVTLDNLSSGWAEAVRYGPLERADLTDRSRVGEVIARHRPVAVMHFAALSLVGDSIRDPGRYWRENVAG